MAITPVYSNEEKIGLLIDMPQRSEEMGFHFSSESNIVPESYLVAALEAIQAYKASAMTEHKSRA